MLYPEEYIDMSRINELLGKKEEEKKCKCGNTVLWVLAVAGAVAAVAGIAYAVPGGAAGQAFFIQIPLYKNGMYKTSTFRFKNHSFTNKGVVICGSGTCVVKNTLPGQKISFMVSKARKGKAEGRILLQGYSP